MNSKFKYLLDTNIISDLVRNPHGVIRDKIIQVGDDAICTSIVVSSELRFGVEKKGSKRLRFQLEAILSAIEVLPLKEPADQNYAVLRSCLEKAGTPIGPNDMLIAAQSITMELILVTANLNEFRRVPGLKVENWLN